jgi:hypothetical protein
MAASLAARPSEIGEAMTEPEHPAKAVETAHGAVHILDRWDVDDTVVLITKHQCHDGLVLGLVIIDADSGEVL